MQQVNTARDHLEEAFIAQRPALVRLCARLTGNVEAAEDLAQETLMAAWQMAHRLRDQEHLAAWLAAIARNMCLRWARSQSRELARRVEAAPFDEESALPLEERLADGSDLELDLERHELADLLDRALGLLPPETRDILVQSYIHELPQAALAERLGLQEGALRVRLHRGKLALRRIFTTDLRQEASAYGLVTPEDAGWQETRIWCPLCGKHRLLALADQGNKRIEFRCPGPCFWPLGTVVEGSTQEIEGGLTSRKALLSRLLLHCHVYYRQGLASGHTICRWGGHLLPVRTYAPSELPGPFRDRYGIFLHCPTCEGLDNTPLSHLTLDLPETRQFWRKHSQMRALPTREIAFAGRPALLTGFESVSDQARLDVISARDTLEVLHVSEGDGQAPGD
jgi:RNA polymerase sigma factor (sigma-70 family)